MLRLPRSEINIEDHLGALYIIPVYDDDDRKDGGALYIDRQELGKLIRYIKEHYGDDIESN